MFGSKMEINFQLVSFEVIQDYEMLALFVNICRTCTTFCATVEICVNIQMTSISLPNHAMFYIYQHLNFYGNFDTINLNHFVDFTLQ